MDVALARVELVAPESVSKAAAGLGEVVAEVWAAQTVAQRRWEEAERRTAAGAGAPTGTWAERGMALDQVKGARLKLNEAIAVVKNAMRSSLGIKN